MLQFNDYLKIAALTVVVYLTFRGLCWGLYNVLRKSVERPW